MKNKKLSLFISVVLLFCVFVFDISNSTTAIRDENVTPSIDSMFQVGEELIYNVSYAFIDIGQIKIKIVEKGIEGEKSYYKARAYLDSYKGIPFVDLHTVYESKITTQLYSTWFKSRTKEDSAWYFYIYTFDYPRNEIRISQGIEGRENKSKCDTISIDTVYQDGLSLLYYARANTLSKKKVVVPTIVSEKKGHTYLNFAKVTSKQSIEAVDYPIDVVYLDGRADFIGVFGLTGDFEGWFSNDLARIPICAKMEVIIGSINIELIKWNRKGWQPPKYVEHK